MKVTNTHLDSILISDYDYSLPESRIAKYPVLQRDQSKLLIYRNEKITESLFSEIPSFIDPESIMIVNNTKVVHARLIFKRSTGSIIEVFLLEPLVPADYSLSFTTKDRVIWKCIVGNLKKWKEHELIMNIGDTEYYLKAVIVNRNVDSVAIEFSWNTTSLSFAAIIEICGRVPIPPYLNRDSEDSDDKDYQTVYAKPEGSVAAPTAGLHFTEKVLNNIKGEGVAIEDVTLHVGAGTFRPVKSDSVTDHEMHTEHMIINKRLVQNLLKDHSSRIAVGTTSLRALESIYWLGVKKLINPKCDTFHLNQWEVYSLPQDIDFKVSYKTLLEVFDKCKVDTLSATTQIMIVPGYKFKTVTHLITNFHQPRSTLLLLIAAFVGNGWKQVYEYALGNDFRFLSYGDSSLLALKE